MSVISNFVNTDLKTQSKRTEEALKNLLKQYNILLELSFKSKNYQQIQEYAFKIKLYEQDLLDLHK